MMKSMTGYGRGECTLYDRRFIIEIKSVNHRYNDIAVKMPRTMLSYEDKIKKTIGTKVFRGKIDVFINYESFSTDDVAININEALADSYVNVLSEIKKKYSLNSDISLELVAKFPDVISVDKNIVNEKADDEISECLFNALNIAIDNFVAMREKEGEALKSDILVKLNIIKSAVSKIEERAPMVVKDYRQRLEEKLKEYVNNDIDESRILTEVLLFADKACIDEELTRLYSHISQMHNILEENNPVGRKLDFLVQEMNREINTIGSKSNDLEITSTIVDVKSEIEKIREQIQNIE